MERFGAALFDRRRTIHLVLFVTALLLGGAERNGMIVGGVLLTLHLGVRLWVCRYIRGAARVHARKAQERKVLVTGGPFGLVRNPLYVANTMGIVGTCLLFGPPWFAAVAAVSSMLWYSLIVHWEESVLTRLYGDDYRRYCALVPRFLPRWRVRAGLPPVDRSELYPWPKVLRRERGAIALGVVACSLALLNQFVL